MSGSAAGWRTQMGAAPGVVVANIGAAGWCDTMDKVCGGPLSVTDPTKIHAGTAWKLDNPGSQFADVWAHRSGITPDTWVWLMTPFARYGCTLDEIRAIARGGSDAHIELAGRRARHQIGLCGHRHDRVGLRSHHEMDQDSGLQLAGNVSYWVACKAAGMTLDAAIQLYADFMGRALAAFRRGYGHHVPVVWSPSQRSGVFPRDWNGGSPPHAKLLAFHDAVCFSFHFGYDRAVTEAQARAMVYGTAPGWNTPAVALAACKAQGKPLFNLEHSPVSAKFSLAYVTPDRDLRMQPVVTALLADWLEENAAWIGGVATLYGATLDEDHLLNLVYPTGHAQAGQKVYADPEHPNVLAWRQSAVIYKTRIGRGAALAR